MSPGPLQGIIGVLLGTLIILPAFLIARPCTGLIVRIQKRQWLTEKWLNIGGGVFVATVLVIFGVSTWFAFDWVSSRTRFILTPGFRIGAAIGMVAPLSLAWIFTCMAFSHACSFAEEDKEK